MSDAAAFSATYADWKLVKTRGVIQIVFEAPIEREAEVYAVLGGMPRAAEERWFAIARLNIGEDQSKTGVPTPMHTTQFSKNDREAARSVQRAALLCYEPEFRLFLEQWSGTKQMIPRDCRVNDEEEAAMVVRSFCRVKSRSEIVPGSGASDRWENLHSQYLVWKNKHRYVEAPRVQQEN